VLLALFFLNFLGRAEIFEFFLCEAFLSRLSLRLSSSLFVSLRLSSSLVLTYTNVLYKKVPICYCYYYYYYYYYYYHYAHSIKTTTRVLKYQINRSNGKFFAAAAPPPPRGDEEENASRKSEASSPPSPFFGRRGKFSSSPVYELTMPW